MGVKQTRESPQTLPQDLQEGVDEEEWVRTLFREQELLQSAFGGKFLKIYILQAKIGQGVKWCG